MVDKSKADDWRLADEVSTDFLQHLLGDKKIPVELLYMPWDNGGLDMIKPSRQKAAVINWFEGIDDEIRDEISIPMQAKRRLWSISHEK